MNQQLLKITGSACLMFLLHTSGFAQEELNPEHDTGKGNSYDEIIIRHKGDKDAKMTVEIRDGQVLVDGKPIKDFEDSTISIHKRKMKTLDGASFSIDGPDGMDLLNPALIDGPPTAIIDGPPTVTFSPFRKSSSWGYNGDDARTGPATPFLGVTSEKTSHGDGARVIAVSRGSAAEKAGLLPGDVITKLDNMDVTDPQSLTEAVRQHQPGDNIVITFSRDGKEQNNSIVLGKNKTEQAHTYAYSAPDLRQFQLQEMPPEFRVMFDNPLKFGIRAQDTEDGKGVKVLDVDDESASAKAGIKEGDIITRFDDKEINSVAALTEAARLARGKISVKVSLIRKGKTQEIEVRVPKKLRSADL